LATLRLVPASGPPVDLDGEQAVVGRDPTCDVVVNDVSVSRKHARLERWGSNWAVIDERSANGTFLDGKRVMETMLQAGQELRFGAVAYRVELEEEQTGATVMMSIPDISATMVPRPPAVPPRPQAARPAATPAPPAPPAPPPPPAPRPAAARPATPPPDIAPAPRVTHPPEPVKQGKGALFWTALGCGGILLLALVGFAVVMGLPFLGSRGAEDAARAQLKDIDDGDLDAAYARTTSSYRAAHSAAAFAAFVDKHPGLKRHTGSTFTKPSVENGTTTISGNLAHAAGSESVVYRLVKEGTEWKVSGIEVDGDQGAAGVASATDGGGLTVETTAINKVAQGQTITVKIDVRVTGFDLRPEGNLFRVDLSEDLETHGPDGHRIEELSRVGLETYNHTTTSATAATATFDTTLTFSKPDPGKYKAILTIRDMVGTKSERHEVPFDLP
jgi:Inner membrane component of T3SS, cytoplasmic domain/Domain of unknown function (DUF4864)